ncbi:MAG: acetamidase/formamidase family protein [Rhabdochlamydiaceae bacterium]|nr:acetamidase/formamidase family protein [Rhabdochlamydiaceae bacterium]
MTKTLISVDMTQSPEKQPFALHNRWHPEIPAIASVTPGEIFRIECIDWTGGQIQDNDSAEDVRTIDLNKVHYLSGPIAVKGAEPGDLLVVEILDIGYLPDAEWGFTGIFSKENGGGFLTDHFPNAYKAIWNFEGIYATSRHIPHVRIAGLMHPGLIGCAPSHALLEKWNKREKELVATHPHRIPPLACLPTKEGALLGTLSEEHKARVALEAARTVPPREHGGNCDIKNLSKGSKLFLPVYVKDALLSVGDLHFSQGDGEIAFCGAIEMAGGWLVLRVDLIKKGMETYPIENPLFEPGPVAPQYSEYLVFEGISVDEQGKQHYLDPHISYKRACLNAIAYLTTFGYTREQAYLLLSAAPCEGRINGIVDIPNACCTIALPKQIFDMDIEPGSTR